MIFYFFFDYLMNGFDREYFLLNILHLQLIYLQIYFYEFCLLILNLCHLNIMFCYFLNSIFICFIYKFFYFFFFLLFLNLYHMWLYEYYHSSGTSPVLTNNSSSLESNDVSEVFWGRIFFLDKKFVSFV